jgi:serine/threonine protein phosphatase 1
MRPDELSIGRPPGGPVTMTAAPRTPDGVVIYAVGDIHGRLDLLQGVTRDLRAGAAQAPQGVRLTAVFLGDYIDRGPDAAGVVEHLIAFRDAGVCETVFLRGKHEQMLLDVIDGQEAGGRWLDNGGAATLAAYGAPAGARPGPERLQALAREAVPPAHRQFLRETRYFAALGDYAFVHGGLEPDVHPKAHTGPEFLSFHPLDGRTPVWPWTVVHGGRPHPKPVRGARQIGLDTQAHASGLLSVLILQGERQAFFRSAVSPQSGLAALSPWRSLDAGYAETRRADPAGVDGPPATRRTRTPQLVAATVAVGAAVLMLQGSAGVAWRDPEALHSAFVNVGVPSSMRAESASFAAGPYAPTPALDVADSRPPPVPASEPAAQTRPPLRPQVRAQVAQTDSLEAAQRAWAELSRALPLDMAARTMETQAESVDGRTVQRTYVTGFLDAEEAREFCARLTAAGRGCIVRPQAQPPDGASSLQSSTMSTGGPPAA